MALTPETVQMIETIAKQIRAEIEGAGSPLAMAAMAQQCIELNARYREQLDRGRTAAIRAALQDGYTYADLARVTGLSRQRIQQLAELPPAQPGRRPANQDRSAEARQWARRDGNNR